MTPEETDRAVEAAQAAVRVARDSLTIARIQQWRAHGDAWLARVRAQWPVPPGSVEFIEHRNVSGIGPVVYVRWIETIDGWEYAPWQSKPRITRTGQESRWSDDPAIAYASERKAWYGGQQISPHAAYAGAAADWRQFCARHGRAPDGSMQSTGSAQ